MQHFHSLLGGNEFPSPSESNNILVVYRAGNRSVQAIGHNYKVGNIFDPTDEIVAGRQS